MGALGGGVEGGVDRGAWFGAWPLLLGAEGCGGAKPPGVPEPAPACGFGVSGAGAVVVRLGGSAAVPVPGCAVGGDGTGGARDRCS